MVGNLMKRKPRKKMTAERKVELKEKKEKIKYRSIVKEIFLKSGFRYIASEGKNFTFKTDGGNRTTELDGIFIHENILIIIEDTTNKKPNEHLAGKRIIFDLILKHKNDFITCLCDQWDDFKNYYNSSLYDKQNYIVKILYFSMYSVGTEHIEGAQRIGIKVIERSLTNYFYSLAKNISESAKYELLKFLDIPFNKVGKAVISGGNIQGSVTYSGFLLPEANSSYPEGFKIISFYADPDTLLKKSYVLRKNGWIDPNLSYQRVFEIKKIRSMRQYLARDKRVFLGNIIATFPHSSKILDIENSNQIFYADQSNVKPVKISLPDEYNVIGLIDGQHRIYSYHECDDVYENEIQKLRHKQNLLVTGIIYPENYSDEDKIRFEAKLFLEINSRQTKVKSILMQEIELIVNPFSPIAIAKSVLLRLSKNGALKDKLEENIFDSAEKLKISSIISYGLRPLIKKEGSDSLFFVWDNEEIKNEILFRNNADALNKYLEYCAKEINGFLNAVKISFPDAWNIGHEKKLLTPTSINGFLRCLRLIIENNLDRSPEFYISRLRNIRDFNFIEYKSSHWNNLGLALYNKFFQ